MYNRGENLELVNYQQVCKSMSDSYEFVRFTSSQLVWKFAQVYPEKLAFNIQMLLINYVIVISIQESGSAFVVQQKNPSRR